VERAEPQPWNPEIQQPSTALQEMPEVFGKKKKIESG
jgi:hypothetical protein